MSLLRKWRRLRANWPLLCTAWSLVCLIRVCLWILPFPWLRKTLVHVGRRTVSSMPHRFAPADTAWAVGVASRYVPAATCLTQALATEFLLSRMGYLSTLHIGVLLREDKGLSAHAWVEYDGHILIGGRNHQQFTPLPPIEFG